MSIDFGRWLKANGLGALVETFQEHDIGFDLLPELTEDDWRELGLTIGQRRRLKCALEADPRAFSVDHLGERRQLTIMFCDLVGSTALATNLDPEDMRIVIRAYQDCCAETIQLYDGAVARFMGDGVMAYFGYPCAHEQNVERAVRAALAITSTVRQLKPLPGLELACRVGIATGVVVVGELIGEGVAVERAVVGETPNLAARIQNLAPANSVVVSDSTRRLAGGLFTYENLGARDLRGFDAPVQIWRVSGETETKGRFEATRASGKLSRFVNHQIELELLQDVWTQCRDESKGQVLVIRGDAGIGKSRIIHVLRRRLAADEHEFLGLQCSPFHVNSAWYPIVDLVRRSSTTADGASPLARVSALREHWPVDREELLLFAGLLQFDMDDTSPARERSYPPELHRERLLNAFEKVLLTLAERRPVLIHLEDAHWMDPSTFELLARVSRLVADIRVLLVVTCRNEIEITLPEDSPTTVVELDRLSASDGRKLVEQVAGDSRLSAEVLDEIVEKTDGIPLFVEEFTKAVVDAVPFVERASEFGEQSRTPTSLPRPAVPSTLHDSLLSRLDRLGTAKYIAQVGAAIGREFSRELLLEVAQIGSHEVDDAIDDLLAANLIYERSGSPPRVFVFNHALTQDVAYGSLLMQWRREIHERIFHALEHRANVATGELIEEIAEHAFRAELWERATDYSRAAGQKALTRSAHREAVAWLEQALSSLSHLDDTDEHSVIAVDIRMDLRNSLIPLARVGDCVERLLEAAEIAERLCDERRHHRIFSFLGACHFATGEFGAAVEATEQTLTYAEANDSAELRVYADISFGWNYYALGRYEEGARHAERAVDFLTGDKAREHYGVVTLPAVNARVWLAMCLGELGRFEDALFHAEAAMELADQVLDPWSLVAASLALGTTCRISGAHDRAVEVLGKGLDVTKRYAVPVWTTPLQASLGIALARAGEIQAGHTQLARALEVSEELGIAFFRSNAAMWLAETELLAGELSRAERRLADLHRELARSKERGLEAYAWLLTGSVALARGESSSCVRDAFERARSLALDRLMLPLVAECEQALEGRS